MQQNTGNSAPGFWTGQLLHLAGLLVLLALLSSSWMWLGRPMSFVFWLAVFIPIFHQIFVWIAWRSELRFSMISKTIGFKGYVALFFLLFGGRFLSLAVLAWFDQGSLDLGGAPRSIIATMLAVPGLYAMYSVHKYFGLARASGADHFEERYRHLPLANKGIFRFTNNGMYLYAFLLFWAIAIGLNSAAALLVAIFSHAYIWLHYFATEKPDMEYIYG